MSTSCPWCAGHHSKYLTCTKAFNFYICSVTKVLFSTSILQMRKLRFGQIKNPTQVIYLRNNRASFSTFGVLTPGLILVSVMMLCGFSFKILNAWCLFLCLFIEWASPMHTFLNYSNGYSFELWEGTVPPLLQYLSIRYISLYPIHYWL